MTAGEIVAGRRVSPHGTVNRYRWHKCRCEPCTRAQRESLRAFRNGGPPPDPDSPAPAKAGLRRDTDRSQGRA